MIDRSTSAARMGYGSAAQSKKAAPAQTPRKAAEGRLYGGYDRPLASYYDRRESRLRDDAEGLAAARAERVKLEAFARTRGISPDDLHEALAVVHEHDLHPRSKGVVDQRREQTKENLRLDLGGTDEAQAKLRQFVTVTEALAKEVPTLAARAKATGASSDPRVIAALSHYGKAP